MRSSLFLLLLAPLISTAASDRDKTIELSCSFGDISFRIPKASILAADPKVAQTKVFLKRGDEEQIVDTWSGGYGGGQASEVNLFIEGQHVSWGFSTETENFVVFFDYCAGDDTALKARLRIAPHLGFGGKKATENWEKNKKVRDGTCSAKGVKGLAISKCPDIWQ